MAYKQIRRRMKQEVMENDEATPQVSDIPEVSHIQTDRDLMTADDALALQDLVGNRAVTQLTGGAKVTTPAHTGYVQPKPISSELVGHGRTNDQPAYANVMRRLGIQRKLTVGAANDPFEREADQVASEVTNSPTVSRLPENQGQGQPQIQPLLAHEITHTPQQSSGKSNTLSRAVKPRVGKSPIIQRAIGRVQPQEIVMKNSHAAYMKGPSIIGASSLDFHKDSPPLVLYGPTPKFGHRSEIAKEFNLIANQKMYIDNIHDVFGQSKGEEFAISMAFKKVKTTEQDLTELFNIRRMFLTQLASQLGNMAITGATNAGSFSGSYEKYLEQLEEAKGAGNFAKDNWLAGLTGLTDSKDKVGGSGLKGSIREVFHPERAESSGELEMVVITPTSDYSSNVYLFNRNTEGVKSDGKGVLLPIKNLQKTFEDALHEKPHSVVDARSSKNSRHSGEDEQSFQQPTKSNEGTIVVKSSFDNPHLYAKAEDVRTLAVSSPALYDGDKVKWKQAQYVGNKKVIEVEVVKTSSPREYIRPGQKGFVDNKYIKWDN